jgi:hypothetical protein
MLESNPSGAGPESQTSSATRPGFAAVSPAGDTFTKESPP